MNKLFDWFTDVPQVRLAAFGESGAGKTTLIAAFFGHLSADEWKNDHGYQLEMVVKNKDDAEKNDRLYNHFLSLKEQRYPDSSHDFDEFNFRFELVDEENNFNKVYVLDLQWNDYPGKWWSSFRSSDPDEEKAQEKALKGLFTSDVGLLLIDGRRFLDDGVNYVNDVLHHFRMKIAAYNNDRKKLFLNRIIPNHMTSRWIFAMTKADLLGSNVSIDVLRNIFLNPKIKKEIECIAIELNDREFGGSLLLLSSVADDGRHSTNVIPPKGLNLLPPLVLKESLTQAALSMNKRGKFYSVAHKAISKRLDSWIIFLPDLLGIAQDQSENDEVSDVNESESDNKFLDENSTYSTKKDISTNNNSWGWILVLISTIEESVDSLKEKGKECSDHSKLTNKLLNSFKKHLDIHKNLWSPWGQI